MARESLRLELLRFLKQEGALPPFIEDWAVAWYRATLLPDEPLPCPACFLEGEMRRLRPADGFEKLGAVECEYCHTRFEFLED